MKKAEDRIQKSEVRRQEKVGGLAKNQKRKDSRIRGFEESSGERQKTEYRSQKSGEGWRVGGLEGWLPIYTSKHLNF